MLNCFQCLHSDHVNSIGIIGSNCYGLEDRIHQEKKNTVNEFEIHRITINCHELEGIVYCMQFALLCTICITTTMDSLYSFPLFTIVFRIHLKSEPHAAGIELQY